MHIVRCCPATKWKSIAKKVGALAASTDSYKRDLAVLTSLATDARCINNDVEGWEKLLSRYGYATTTLCHLLANALGSKTFNSLSFLFDAAEDFKCKLNVDDVFLITKRFSTGITDDFIIVNTSGSPVRICGVSRISEELRQSVLLFPPFFLFLYNKEELSEPQFPDWGKQFGQILWGKFAAWLKNDIIITENKKHEHRSRQKSKYSH